MGETPKISHNSAMGAVPGGRELILKRASVISLSEALTIPSTLRARYTRSTVSRKAIDVPAVRRRQAGL